jgi:catechol 2,3-dioxygenase-like lactoylglutathione lyase family enzyme
MAVDTTRVVVPPPEAIPVPETSAPLRLQGWDHIGFSVPDLVEAEHWYIDVLGAELVERRGWGGQTAHPVPPHVDVRIGSNVLSLFLGDPITGASDVPRHYHYAFTCPSLDELEQWQAHLRAKGVNLRNDGAVHGHPGSGAVSLYFEDPWGAKLEITTWLSDWATAEAEVAKRGGVIMGAQNAGGHRPAR